MERKYDILLFGATGFTGQLIAAYLSDRANMEGVSWAIAGRSPNKLEQVRAALKGKLPELVVADVENEDSLKAMAAQARIVMNAVGPFNWYGKGVVKACVEQGTHYLDITGEPSFVADIFQTFGKEAEEKKVCIVNCCGFDSIPADYAAWLTAKQLPVGEAKALRGYIRTNASFSGGTFTTAIYALYMETQQRSIKVKLPRHPDTPRIPLKIHYNNELKAWAIPMPVVDPHIVKRSAYRLSSEYGEAVAYGQFFLRSSFWKVVKTVVPVVITMLFVRFKFFREWLFRQAPPGTGPDEEMRSRSRFEVTCIGESDGSKARTVISGGDPGYNETAKMFSEAAFTILERSRALTLPFGVLTPVEAFGQNLKERLQRAGIFFSN
jgi:short subunit dehydrogenase-like uncharacterized protein